MLGLSLRTCGRRQEDSSIKNQMTQRHGEKQSATTEFCTLMVNQYHWSGDQLTYRDMVSGYFHLRRTYSGELSAQRCRVLKLSFSQLTVDRGYTSYLVVR